MKLSGNGARGSGATGMDSLIGRQTEILGDVRFAGGLHVDGKVRGKVLSDGGKDAALSLSEHGSIEGDVRVPIIMLNGSVHGDVYASERLTMAAKARVYGNVYYRVLEMEAGAQVNGQLVHEAQAPLPGTHLHRESERVLDELGEARRNKGLGNG